MRVDGEIVGGGDLGHNGGGGVSSVGHGIRVGCGVVRVDSSGQCGVVRVGRSGQCRVGGVS